MLSTIPPEISIASFSLIGVLTGYIWNAQSKRISENKKILEKLPCNSVCSQIIEIRTDIKWIKAKLK